MAAPQPAIAAATALGQRASTRITLASAGVTAILIRPVFSAATYRAAPSLGAHITLGRCTRLGHQGRAVLQW